MSPLSGLNKQVYDAAGHLVTLVDPDGNQTTFIYDRTGKKTTETDASGHSIVTAYDNAGRVTSITDRKSRKRRWESDLPDRRRKPDRPFCRSALRPRVSK